MSSVCAPESVTSSLQQHFFPSFPSPQLSAPRYFPPPHNGLPLRAANTSLRRNVTYGVENNYDLKLDVYDRADVATPQPTLIFIHGGGWVGGNKEYIVTSLLPWMAQGWNVVNVEYRLAESVAGARRGRRLSLRAAVGCAERREISLRSETHGGYRRIGRRAPGR